MKCLKTGVKILIEPPFAYVLNNSCYHTHCAYCLTEGQLHKCLGCHLFSYCSKICQEKGWSDHKSECKNIQRININYRSQIPNIVLLMSRILYKIRKNNLGCSLNSFVDENLTFPPGRNFDELVTHKNEYLNDSQQITCFNSCSLTLSKLLPKHIFSENVSKLLDIYCKVHHILFPIFKRMAYNCYLGWANYSIKARINSYNIMDDDLRQIANALYIKGSYFNHSCLPNTNLDFNGPDIIVSLTEDVNIDENENFQDKIFISYGQPLDSYKNRQRKLNEQFYFKCQCKLCMSRETLNEYDWSAFPKELRCTSVDQEDIEAFQIPMITKLIGKLSSGYVGMDKNSIRNSLNRNPFPISNNVLYNKCLMETIIARYAEEESFDDSTMLMLYHLELAFKHGNALSSYYPYNSVTRVSHLIWLAKLAFCLYDLPSATSHFIEAQNIYKNALSPTKPLKGIGTENFENKCVGISKTIRDSLQELQETMINYCVKNLSLKS